MQLTIPSPVPGREPALIKVPASFVISPLVVQRLTRKLLAPFPESFVAPEEPDYLWRATRLDDGGIKLAPEPIAVRARRRN